MRFLNTVIPETNIKNEYFHREFEGNVLEMEFKSLNNQYKAVSLRG